MTIKMLKGIRLNCMYVDWRPGFGSSFWVSIWSTASILIGLFALFLWSFVYLSFLMGIVLLLKAKLLIRAGCWRRFLYLMRLFMLLVIVLSIFRLFILLNGLIEGIWLLIVAFFSFFKESFRDFLRLFSIFIWEICILMGLILKRLMKKLEKRIGNILDLWIWPLQSFFLLEQSYKNIIFQWIH